MAVKTKRRCTGLSPVAKALVKRDILATIATLRTTMGLQAYMGQDVSAIAHSAGRLFFIVAHAANAAGYGNSPEGSIILGASSALGDVVEIPGRLEQQRGAIISGLSAVDRLLPKLTALQLADGAFAFEGLLKDTAELRTTDLQKLLPGTP